MTDAIITAKAVALRLGVSPNWPDVDGVSQLVRDVVAATGGKGRLAGANFIVRGGAHDVMEGKPRERNFVIEFRDRATAIACYQSPEYQRAVAIRQKFSDADLIIIDGDS